MKTVPLSSPLILALLFLAGVLPATHAASVTLTSQEQAIASYMINDSNQGRPSLKLDPTIEAVARARAKDMAERGYFAHVNPDGVAANYLLRQAGYQLPSWWGTDPSANYVESIAAGYSDPSSTWTAWMNSPEHKVHLLAQNSFFATETNYGVGFYYDPNSTYKYYWVVITAPPQPAPALAVTTPTANQKVNTDSVNVAGTTLASTNPASVQFRVENSAGTSDYQAATGLADWSGTATGLTPGVNIIRVQSLDGSGNVIAEVARTISYLVPGTLNVSVSGSGGVTSAYLGTTTQNVGLPVTISARAAAGSVFAGWTGAVTSGNATITFSMQDGDSIQANFIPNPFPPAGGSYFGVLTDSGTQSGLVKFTLAGNGRFTGKVTEAGIAWAFAGQLDANGDATITIPRHGQQPIVITLQTSLDGSGQVTGAISDGTSDTTFTASQSTFNTHTNAAPQAGRYTVVLAANPGETGTSAPQGNGFATLNVSTNGSVTIAGRLGDGTPYSVTGYLGNDGTLSIFTVPSKEKKGSYLNGLLTFRSSSVSDVDGVITWRKVAKSTDAFYKNGFSIDLPSVGSRYVKPGTTLQPLAVTSGTATAGFGSGDLSQPLDVPVIVTRAETATMITPGLPDLKLGINSKTGIVTGSLILPSGKVRKTFSGVVLQKQNSAYGYFQGADQYGYFSLTQG